MIKRKKGDMIVGNWMMCVKSMITEVGLDFEERKKKVILAGLR